MRKIIERRQIKVVRHPSGRPIADDRTIDATRYRIPESGPLTPRLRRDSHVEAIGFTAPWLAAAPDDGE